MTDLVRNDIFGVWHTGMAERLDSWLKCGGNGLGETLSLYHNVLSTFVTPGGTRPPDPEAKPVRLDNLLCKGDEALLAIFENNAAEDQHSACKALGLACVTFSGGEDDDELCDEYVETYLNRYLEQTLGRKRRGGVPPRYAARVLQRAAEDADEWAYVDEGQWVYDRMKETRMLVQVETDWGPLWYSTWYGAEMGLAGAMLPGHERLSHVCAEAAWDRAWAAIDGCPREPEEGALPLGRRLERAARGEKAPEAMGRIVGDFGAMPLRQWMTDCPDGLRQLSDAGLDPEGTYQQAASRIYEMLRDEEREEQGRRLLMALSAPHTKGGSEPF